jgi:hypothetical protein
VCAMASRQRRQLLARRLAPVLPFSFLWVFCACVWLCSDKPAPGSTDAPSLSACATSSEQSERCPITAAAPRGVLPDRSRIDPHSNTDGSTQAAVFPERSGYDRRFAPVRAYSTWDSPPKTCRVLLI